MKSNIAPFYIGQKVVYITGINMPKNSRHTVYDIKQDDCGCWVIAIGCHEYGKKILLETLPSGHIWKCPECHKIHSGDAFMGWYASSFRPAEEISLPFLTFKQVRETEVTKPEPVLALNN